MGILSIVIVIITSISSLINGSGTVIRPNWTFSPTGATMKCFDSKISQQIENAFMNQQLHSTIISLKGGEYADKSKDNQFKIIFDRENQYNSTWKPQMIPMEQKDATTFTIQRFPPPFLSSLKLQSIPDAISNSTTDKKQVQTTSNPTLMSADTFKAILFGTRLEKTRTNNGTVYQPIVENPWRKRPKIHACIGQIVPPLANSDSDYVHIKGASATGTIANLGSTFITEEMGIKPKSVTFADGITSLSPPRRFRNPIPKEKQSIPPEFTAASIWYFEIAPQVYLKHSNSVIREIDYAFTKGASHHIVTRGQSEYELNFDRSNEQHTQISLSSHKTRNVKRVPISNLTQVTDLLIEDEKLKSIQTVIHEQFRSANTFKSHQNSYKQIMNGLSMFWGVIEAGSAHFAVGKGLSKILEVGAKAIGFGTNYVHDHLTDHFEQSRDELEEEILTSKNSIGDISKQIGAMYVAIKKDLDCLATQLTDEKWMRAYQQLQYYKDDIQYKVTQLSQYKEADDYWDDWKEYSSPLMRYQHAIHISIGVWINGFSHDWTAFLRTKAHSEKMKMARDVAQRLYQIFDFYYQQFLYYLFHYSLKTADFWDDSSRPIGVVKCAAMDCLSRVNVHFVELFNIIFSINAYTSDHFKSKQLIIAAILENPNWAMFELFAEQLIQKYPDQVSYSVESMDKNIASIYVTFKDMGPGWVYDMHNLLTVQWYHEHGWKVMALDAVNAIQNILKEINGTISTQHWSR